MTSKLSILSNYTEHSKKLVCLLYALPPFYIFVIVYLDDILIYTKNEGKKYIKAVW